MGRYPGLAAALAGLMLLVMAMGACQASAPAPAKAPTGGTTSPTATSQDVVAASAVVVPYRQAALGIKTGGRVTEISVTSGSAVTQGQPLAKVDARDLEL